MAVARRDWLERQVRPSMAAHRRAAKRRSEYFCRIEVSAFAAVLCGLLFAFLAPTSQPHTGGAVDLAKSQQSKRLPSAVCRGPFAKTFCD